jgi:hypothetical protein
MQLEEKIAPAPNVIEQRVADETVLLDLSSELYFGLDPVGTRVWELLGSGQTVQAIYDQLVTEFDVDATRLLNDLRAVLNELRDAGLVVAVEQAEGNH